MLSELKLRQKTEKEQLIALKNLNTAADRQRKTVCEKMMNAQQGKEQC